MLQRLGRDERVEDESRQARVMLQRLGRDERVEHESRRAPVGELQRRETVAKRSRCSRARLTGDPRQRPTPRL